MIKETRLKNNCSSAVGGLKIWLTISMTLSISSNCLPDEQDDEVYRPYPVIFVHGFNSDRSAWTTAISNLREYYSKYDFTDENDYFPYFNYGFANHGHCESIAGLLGSVVVNAIANMGYMSPPVPENKRKVIIVCHSFGGLVTRYMLKAMYLNYIDKVIFLGVPHRGSPLASICWFVNAYIKKGELEDKINHYKILAKDLFENQDYDEASAYEDLAEEIKSVVNWNNSIRNLCEFKGILIGEPCIEQLRVPSTILCTAKLYGSSDNGRIVEYSNPEGYRQSDTFINNANLAVPKNKKSIIGTGGFWGSLGEIGTRIIYYKSPYSVEGFPYDNGLNALGEGDGVVTNSSQTLLGNDFTVNKDHVNETSQWETILQAIDDDPPEVVKVEAYPKNGEDKWWLLKDSDEFYIVIGIKEYLLADIEITKLDLNSISLLNKIKNGRPYDQWGKEFLKERDAPFNTADGKPYKLKPGEFCILVKIPEGEHSLTIKLKNPAEVESKLLTTKITRPYIKDLEFENTWGYKNIIDINPPVDPDNIVTGPDGHIKFNLQEDLLKSLVLRSYISDNVADTKALKTFQDSTVALSPGGQDFNFYWNGTDDNGSYLNPNSKPYMGRHYPLVVIVKPVDNLLSLNKCGTMNANYTSIYADPTFIKEIVYHNSGLHKDMSKNGLTAKIDFPRNGSLLRADIPVCGLACGEDFERFVLDYGRGDNPSEWTTIKESDIPQKDYIDPGNSLMNYGKSIDGNLGMWETGLTEYYYKNYPVDLNGEYTLRLRVYNDKGMYSEDRIKVTVGRVALNCMDNKIESLDGKLTINIPEHSLEEKGILMAVQRAQKHPDVNTENKLASEIYKIIPNDLKFTKPIKIEIKIDEIEEGKDKMYVSAYNSKTEKWEYLETKICKDNKEGHLLKSTLPQGKLEYEYLAAVISKTKNHKVICSQKEEVSSDIELVNKPFNVRNKEILSFDYKMDKNTEMDIYVKMKSGEWYNIGFSDRPNVFWDVNITKAGEIKDVLKDNRWHKAKINIKELLEPLTNEQTVEKVIMKNWDVTGYKELIPGKNISAGVCIKNISYLPAKSTFKISFLRNKQKVENV
jgi:hypothetical protein